MVLKAGTGYGEISDGGKGKARVKGKGDSHDRLQSWMAIHVGKNQAAGVQRSARGSGDENTAKKCKNHNEMS